MIDNANEIINDCKVEDEKSVYYLLEKNPELKMYSPKYAEKMLHGQKFKVIDFILKKQFYFRTKKSANIYFLKLCKSAGYLEIL